MTTECAKKQMVAERGYQQVLLVFLSLFFFFLLLSIYDRGKLGNQFSSVVNAVKLINNLT